MTPQELAELPEGTRIKLNMIDEMDEGDVLDAALGEIDHYEYGAIHVAGVYVQILWDQGFPSQTCLDTKSDAWIRFISEISVA